MKTRFFPASERGHASHGWLDTYHSFSFAHFYNPELLGFGKLLVVNDDSIAPGRGFGEHPHQNMEIITIPLEGTVKHEDNTGGSGRVSAGEVQIMSAGTAVAHSEVNASATRSLRLFQIWIEPNVYDITPRYEEKQFDPRQRKEKFQLLVSPDGREGSLMIHQEAYISLAHFEKGTSVTYQLHGKNQGAFVMTIEGGVKIGEHLLKRRDAVGVSEIDSFSMKIIEESEVLLIEIPMG